MKLNLKIEINDEDLLEDVGFHREVNKDAKAASKIDSLNEMFGMVLVRLVNLRHETMEDPNNCSGKDIRKSIDDFIDNIKETIEDFKEEQKMTNRLGQSKTENFGSLDQLVEQVQLWSIDKDLHKGNSDRQALKFYEEAGEVAAALSRGQTDALKDGIGDTVVTLIILAQQHDMTLQECLQFAYDEIKGRKGKTINGTFIKEADLKE